MSLYETLNIENNKHIKNLKVSMMEYAENLDFEKAAQIRDEIKELEKNEIGVK